MPSATAALVIGIGWCTLVPLLVAQVLRQRTWRPRLPGWVGVVSLLFGTLSLLAVSIGLYNSP